MRFPSGVVASCNTTYGANMPGFYRVHGSRGMIHVEPAFSYDGLRLTARIQGEQPIDEPNTEKDPAQFTREADHLVDSIVSGKEPKISGQEGLLDMKYMMEIYRSCGRRG
jgi:predicted dehydrogenase